MYFFTSWGWNPFALEGNKPIWSPIRGPDGWLSLFPILSPLAIPSSRRHDDHAPASSENPKHEVVYKWKRSDVVSLLRNSLHNTLIVFERNVSFKELLCLEDLRDQLINHVWHTSVKAKPIKLNELSQLLIKTFQFSTNLLAKDLKTYKQQKLRQATSKITKTLEVKVIVHFPNKSNSPKNYRKVSDIITCKARASCKESIHQYLKTLLAFQLAS